MQYKIPVQIENEDPILLWLSIRQLIILLIGWFITYSTFKSVAISVWTWIALIPAVVLWTITLAIALFKYSEMTFLPFIISLLRFLINTRERVWKNTVDSFQPIDIWYIVINEKKVEEIKVKDKNEKLKKIEDKMDKI
jgi:pyruvate/2-oxoacid:ferredoxin oxidoreductase alpha subunit